MQLSVAGSPINHEFGLVGPLWWAPWDSPPLSETLTDVDNGESSFSHFQKQAHAAHLHSVSNSERLREHSDSACPPATPSHFEKDALDHEDHENGK